MIRDNLHTFHLKITTLSPVHIGTGEAYEPTNFVIDGGKLFEFDEILFYQSLSMADKNLFGQKINNWMNLIAFYRLHVKEAKVLAQFECEVSKKVESTYKKLKNDDGSKRNNQFQIVETFKNPNTHRAVIPGSSIKGMLDTILGIYARKVKSNEPRQRLILSDALLLDGGSEIGYAYRKHKNPSKTVKSEIPQMVEIITSGSTFLFTITTEHSFSEIQNKMRAYHNDRKYSEYKQTVNSFVARVGKFCGKEYMVDSGKNVLNSYDKPIATHTLYESGDDFGWIDIEQISLKEYQSSLNAISNQEYQYYNELEERQKEIIEKITYEKEKQKAFELAKKKAKEEEEKAEEEAKEKREAELASMTPIQRLIDSYDDIAILINDMKTGQVEDFENIKVELAREVKKILQQNPKTWDKAKKKALDRKGFIEGLLK